MNTTLKSMLIAAAALTAVSSFAQDKATLDLLVKKGLITAEERAKTLDESAQARAASGVGRVFPKEDATKRLTISGYFQAQYENFAYGDQTGAAYNTQSSFLMRRLYLEILADIGEGISGNVVFDMSGNTASSIDRAIVTLSGEQGTIDMGYKKVAWGYEESTLSSLFKASSSKLLTVERGITNRYWNEAENNSTKSTDATLASNTVLSSGRRLGFGAHHLGLHYTSVANPQGFEYGLSVTNAAQGFNNKGLNDIATYANAVWNNKVSDNEKYAVGANWGRGRYFNGTAAGLTANKSGLPVDAQAVMSGYNPFVQAQYFNWLLNAEYMNTKITNTADGAPRDYTPTGYNATVAYKINDNWEGVVRYTSLDTDKRGQKISDGVRDFNKTNDATQTSDYTFNTSDSWYAGLNYYFTIPVAGAAAVNGPNAKIQLGYEHATFQGKVTASLAAGGNTVDNSKNAKVDSVRLQAQIAF
jgi:hypothetical protein